MSDPSMTDAEWEDSGIRSDQGYGDPATAGDNQDAAIAADASPDNLADADETTQVAAETTGGGKRSTRPVYALEPVGDDLPEQDSGRTSSGPRASQWLKVLQPIVDDTEAHGVWFKVADYSTATGAKLAKKTIEEDGRDVPEGGTWEFDVRRFTEDNKRVSKLYARFTAE